MFYFWRFRIIMSVMADIQQMRVQILFWFPNWKSMDPLVLLFIYKNISTINKGRNMQQLIAPTTMLLYTCQKKICCFLFF